MNRILMAVFTAALLCGSLLGQSPQSPSTESAPEQPQQIPTTDQPAAPAAPAQATPAQAAPTNAPRIAPGSVIPARLTKTVNAKKAKKGDEVVATVTQDLRNNAGTVIVPKDTKIVGHVTEAQASSKQQKESEVAIAFDRAVPKSGKEMQMPMSIQAIVAPPRPPANANQQPSGYPGPETGGVPAASGGRTGSMGGGTMGGGSTPTTGAAPTSGSGSAQGPAGA